MTYTPREYPEIVRDLLTNLTRGTIRESHRVDAVDQPVMLVNTPVRRVSHLTGTIEVGKGEKKRSIPYKFTAADFELVATSGDQTRKDAIRFRKEGRKPQAGSSIVVNYYPVQTDPVPLTDLNVGSVIRTLLETIAYEMGITYQHLEHIYESAYLDTAEGDSLDKVVALVGLRRLPAGYPVVKVRFSRQAGTPGEINIPAGTALTDTKGNRYLTSTEVTLEPNEASRQVRAQGETSGTPPVDQDTLTVLEVTIAGVSQVTNPQPAYRLSAAETDDELRRRASQALHGVVRGTVDALHFGLISIPGVKDVAIIEAPNGVPGEIKIEVAYQDNSPEVHDQVTRRIDELRPAGIRVISSEAAHLKLNVRLQLTLAGSGLPDAELNELKQTIEARLADFLAMTSPGAKIRRAKLSSLVLEDARVVDVTVTLLPEGQPEAEEFSLGTGQVLDVVRPFTFLAPIYESKPGTAPVVTSTVSAILPVHLVAGVTLVDASQAINLALDSYLNTRKIDTPLTVDGLAAAIRDDTRFALVRAGATLIVETYNGRFLQLTDGVGEYRLAEQERLQKGQIDIQPQEGNL